MNKDEEKISDFGRIIERVESRKLKERRRRKKSEWTGLGLIGAVGWTVVIPTVACTALGVWLDRAYPQSFSWTLSFLIGGLILGCVMAYNLVKKETDSMDDNEKQKI